jgi:hypothetical protein
MNVKREPLSPLISFIISCRDSYPSALPCKALKKIHSSESLPCCFVSTPRLHIMNLGVLKKLGSYVGDDGPAAAAAAGYSRADVSAGEQGAFCSQRVNLPLPLRFHPVVLACKSVRSS